MSRILRIAIALAAGVFLVTVARAATASSLVELDRGQGIIFIQTTGPDTTAPVTVGVPGSSQTLTLEPLAREADRTLYRSPQLSDGVYDVRIGQNASLHALYRTVTLSDLQLVEDQITALEAQLARISASLVSIAGNLSQLEQADDNLHQNVSALAESIGRVQGGVVGVQSSLDSNRVPSGIAMEGDLKDAEQRIQSAVEESSQRFPLWSLALLALHVATLAGLVYLFVAQRRAAKREAGPVDVPASRILSPASRVLEDLARQGPGAGIPAHVVRINDAIESTRSTTSRPENGLATAMGEPSGTGASPPGQPQAPPESPPPALPSVVASREPEASLSHPGSRLDAGEPRPEPALEIEQVTPGEGNYRLMGRPA